MANEITMTASLTVSKSSAAINSGTITKQLTLTGNHCHTITQSITTGGVALDLGGVTTPGGYILFRNLDATNFVTLSNASGDFAIVRAGCLALFQPDAAVTATADTATCICQTWMVDI